MVKYRFQHYIVETRKILRGQCSIDITTISETLFYSKLARSRFLLLSRNEFSRTTSDAREAKKQNKKTKKARFRWPMPGTQKNYTRKVVCSCALHLDFIIQFRSHFKQQTSIRNRDDNRAKGDCVTYLLMAYSNVES